MKSIQESYLLLQIPKNIIITMHQKPDGDALGSALALYHFLQKQKHQVQVIAPTNWAAFLDWMPSIESVIDYERKTIRANAMIEKADIIYCLDFNTLHRTKLMAPVVEKAKAVKILIDHHELPQKEAFDYGISIPEKSSTCEMIYDFIMESPWKQLFDTTIATCIYTGMMTDTGSFKFSSTHASTHQAAAHCLSMGIQHTAIHENIIDSNSLDRMRLLGNTLLNRLEILPEYNAGIIAIPHEDFVLFNTQTGDTEGFVNHILSIKGLKLAAFVTDRGEERKWSFRSKGNFDVNLFARNHFNGGGHKNAAGASTVKPLQKTVEDFKEILKNYKLELNS